MTLDDDDPDASKGFSTQFMLQNKMSMANNVLVKRRLQLKHWENSDMNKLAASKKPSIDTKVKFQDSDVFLSACVSGDEEEVEDLLEKGANINTCTIDGVTALHQAVIDGKLETVRFLLDHGADLNAQDNEGWTPLHAAVCCGILAIVKYLCERGADLSHVNSDKELAIDLAEDDEIRAYLEEQLRIQNVNADECRDREFHTMMRDCTEWIRCGRYLDKPHPRTGATALHVASSKGYNQLIGLLIRAGANVDAKDFEGWTPLHAAAHWGEKDACRILMENGAKLSGLTNTGQDVLRVADANIVEFLENLQEQIEQSSPAQPPISPNNVLVENNNIPAPSKRPPSVQRLSSEEKHTLQKKDEHDENVSLSTKVLESISNDSPPEDHSISPPPAKKQEIEPKEKEPTPIENIVLHGVKLRKQRSVESPSEQSTFVTAVLPAPKFTAMSSTPSSSRESSVSKSNGSASETISERESSVTSNSSVSTSSSTAVIRNTPTPVPVIRSQRMVFPSEERRSPEYQSTSKSEEEASASSSTVPSGSESASRSCSEEVGTGSQISSIRTSSRSVSSKDSISSNLYSSDQNVECTLRMNQPVAPRVSTNSSSTTATRPTWNNSQNITTRPSVSNSSSSSVSSETTTTNTRKVFPVISQQSAGLAPLARVTSPSSSESPSPSPLGSPASNTGMFRKTGPVVSNVQRSASASSTSVPWLAHLKSTSMSNVGRSVSVMNNQSVLSPPATPTTPKAFEPPTPPYRPTISRPIQPSSAYLKYSAQIRSWQTPPTQPAPQKETEAERKAKARIQRAARRSTQGVTADQLNEARAASDDFGKWKSSTLQQTITTSNTNADTYSSSTEAESISKTTTEESASQKNSHVMANLLLPASCPSPSSTPSAAKMNRRSQASRGNRRGTGPVDLDALNNAISISTPESSESSHPVNDPKVTRVTVSMKERLGSSEIMNASKSLETDNTSRFPSVSSTTRTSGPTSKPLLSSTYANGTITTSADASDRYKILYEKEREENERLRRKIDDLNLRLSKTEINGNVWQNNGGRNSHNSNSDTGRSNSTPLDDQERRSYERKIGELEYELGKTKQLQADNKRLKDENGALIRVISKLSKPSS